MNDPSDEYKVLAVGSDLQRGSFKVYDHKEDFQLNVICQQEQPMHTRRYTDICYVKSFANSIENLVVGTDKGQIKVFGMPPYLN